MHITVYMGGGGKGGEVLKISNRRMFRKFFIIISLFLFIFQDGKTTDYLCITDTNPECISHSFPVNYMF